LAHNLRVAVSNVVQELSYRIREIIFKKEKGKKESKDSVAV